jgi:hypothetical protein
MRVALAESGDRVREERNSTAPPLEQRVRAPFREW